MGFKRRQEGDSVGSVRPGRRSWDRETRNKIRPGRVELAEMGESRWMGVGEGSGCEWEEVKSTLVQARSVAGFDKDGRRDAASGSVKLSGGEAGPMAVAECSKMDQSLDVW
ncbi:hypothetical protein MHUMG1_09213 [Metarhizium humberi]|uniref:Uncharacterized protein n=1 Tax=Metarhizium humberi TaxID=2596975 RepID=A0A9P8S2Y0_9HYPO|nr:hypothetical protein MHUMG1_09213 [Metarhizium humberi]